ncbi:unnamed protein product [Durusdinium trenchii]|uniref:Fatty acid desaturase domain-containing protein n=1 Tax=Durusdinium trenchii TaxID=1381693 RepID=A0ABP0I7F7_9DINO
MGLAHDTDELRRVLRSCRKDVAERQNEQSYAAIGEVLLLWICNFSATGCASNDQGCLLLFWFFIELVVAIWKRCVEQELLVVGMHITLALQCLSCYFCRLPGVSWILLFVCTAIAQRALENLVHEHSHGNLLRPSNHWLARVTGFLVYKDLEEYRSSHRIHHQKFGLDEDPDRIVYGRAATRPLLGKVSVVCVWYHENLQKKGLWIQVVSFLNRFDDWGTLVGIHRVFRILLAMCWPSPSKSFGLPVCSASKIFAKAVVLNFPFNACLVKTTSCSTLATAPFRVCV